MNIKTLWHSNSKSTDRKSVLPGNLDSFKYKTGLETRFADFDMLGHVNNAVYFTYMEMARSRYWAQAISWDWEKTGVVIAQAAIDYLNPVYLKDKITMYVRTTRIGQTSFDLAYLLVKHVHGKEVPCATGKTVCVAIDYATHKPVPVPEAERSKMASFEQL